MDVQSPTPQVEKQKVETDRLIKILIGDFIKHIEPEKQPFVILLKGHLLLEYYLNQIVLLYAKGIKNVERRGFFDKVSLLKTTDGDLFKQETFSSLLRLNELRNRLSHSLNFKITPSEIDTVGFCLGKNYVLAKYENPDNEEVLLKWVLREIAQDVFYPIYVAVAKSKGLTPVLRE